MPPSIQKSISQYVNKQNSESQSYDEAENVNIDLMTEEINRDIIFVVEASKLSVIDKACTNPVTGEQWYDYVVNFPEKFKPHVNLPNQASLVNSKMVIMCILLERLLHPLV